MASAGLVTRGQTQVKTASISGHIKDEQGAQVNQAEVRLRSRDGLLLVARSDATGSFRFDGLGDGNYFLEVSATGFATLTSESMQLDRGATQTVELVLKVEGISENVVVTERGAEILSRTPHTLHRGG